MSFTKGCYVGQENTARMHHRDKLRRRLLPVRFDGDPGDGAIAADGRDAGELRSHRDGRGMAWLRVEAASAPLTLNGAAVTTSTGPTGCQPQAERLLCLPTPTWPRFTPVAITRLKARGRADLGETLPCS